MCKLLNIYVNVNYIAGNQQAYNNAPAYQPAPAYQQAAPQYNPGQSAAQLPAGVDAHACPNYPYCS